MVHGFGDIVTGPSLYAGEIVLLLCAICVINGKSLIQSIHLFLVFCFNFINALRILSGRTDGKYCGNWHWPTAAEPPPFAHIHRLMCAIWKWRHSHRMSLVALRTDEKC